MSDQTTEIAAEAADDIGALAHKNEPTTNAYYPEIACSIIQSAIEKAVKNAIVERDQEQSRAAQGSETDYGDVCMKTEETLRHWQDTIRDELVRLTGNDNIDGAGCESGDPLDFTIAEIRQAFQSRSGGGEKWTHVSSGYSDGDDRPYRTAKCGDVQLFCGPENTVIAAVNAHNATLQPRDNQRLYDLVRYCRVELHEAKLITDEEYAALVENGSESARRLEDYDKVMQHRDCGEDTKRLDWLFVCCNVKRRTDAKFFNTREAIDAAMKNE